MTLEKSKRPLQIWQITKVNLRHNFLPLCSLSAVIMLLTPILFGTNNLDSKACAVPLEMLISIIGIIMLVPIFWPEQNNEIEDIVASKYMSLTYVYFIRITYSILGIVLLVLIFSGFMFLRGCEITVGLIFGTIADAMFLGGMGLLAAAITNNLSVSFMIPFLYYVMNITMKSKLGNFNLMAMMNGNYKPNLWLLAGGIIFTVISVIMKRAVARRQ